MLLRLEEFGWWYIVRVLLHRRFNASLGWGEVFLS